MTTITKKNVTESLATYKDWTNEEIENLWNDIKKNGFAWKFKSVERLEKFWNRYSFVLSDTFLK